MARRPRDLARVAEVERRMLADEPSTVIAREVSVMFEVVERTIYTDIKRQWEAWEEARKETLERRRVRHLARLTARLNRAIARKDNRGEDATLDRMARIEGLYVTPPEDEAPVGDAIADKVRASTSTKLRQRIAELQTKANALAAEAAARAAQRKGE